MCCCRQSWGAWYCRICRVFLEITFAGSVTASRLDCQKAETVIFPLRTEDTHKGHLKTIENNGFGSCCGVKAKCVLSEKLNFDVTTGFPPDIAHDLFEGIVPFEIALCLTVFISKNYFTLSFLNKLIADFPYQWTDKVNRPHAIPVTFATKKTVGGNCHENWSLIRFLPLLIGQTVPPEEPAWQLLLDLKDIVDLVVSPMQTEESIAYLSFNITEHKVRFKEVFPDTSLLPKHHFLQHYPHLICHFGSLVQQWTIHFEAKHSFFKRVVQHTRCFKNVLLSLAERHQFAMAHQLYICSVPKSPLLVTHVSSVPIDVLKEDIAFAIRQKYSELDSVFLTQNASYNGINYRNGMIVSHGSLAGMPKFAEIIQNGRCPEHTVLCHQEVGCMAVGTLSRLRTEDMPHKGDKTGPSKSAV